VEPISISLEKILDVMGRWFKPEEMGLAPAIT